MTKLTDEHRISLQLRLDEELTRYHDKFEERAKVLGRSLSDRERRQMSFSSELHGPQSIRTLVLAFNMAAILCEEADGVAVPVRLQIPRLLRDVETSRPIGSADSNKVLTPEQLAQLERALGSELRQYDKATALLNRQFTSLDVRSVGGDRPTPDFDVERYFGLNGIREHTTDEIASLRGLSPKTGPDVPRRIKRFLAPRIGLELAVKLLQLRSQFIKLRTLNRLAELKASREFIRDVLSKCDLSVPDLKAACVEWYFGLNGRQILSREAIGEHLDLPVHKVAVNIRSRLASLVGKNRAKRLLAIRRRLRTYLSRAIKAQALRLQLASARRISAIVTLTVEPEMRVHLAAGRRIVEIQFHAGKTWGDEGILEWVPCIDRFGEIAEDAILTTQRLTKGLRLFASKGVEKRLFIIPDKFSTTIVPLSSQVLQSYLYSNQPGKPDLLRRYGLEGLLNFATHHFRHTKSTHMIEAGATIQDVARYLGHITLNGSTTMAGTFYLAGGTEAMRRRTVEALRKGAATGVHFDGLARMKIEAMGSEAKNALVPPNQLSFEQARQRILSADIVELVPIEPAEAIQLADQKTVFNVTRYGGCLLQATSGHCPTANPCPIGILPKDAEPIPGCGCKYLVLLPHSDEQLNKDIAIMEAQLTKMSGESWAEWRSHTEAKLAHYRSLLQTAKSLNGSH
jgi:integrase